jgi:hypothetical protein
MADQHLEAEIEHLRDATERCRKIDLGTKLAIGVGVACLASAVVWFKPVALVVGVALVLGGLALHGSNRSTLDEIVARIKATEARRAELIDSLELQTVADVLVAMRTFVSDYFSDPKRRCCPC